MKKKNIGIGKSVTYGVLAVAVCSCCFGVDCAYAYDVNVKPISISLPWMKYGYTNVFEYHDALIEMNEESVGIADDAIDRYSDVITDEQEDLLRDYEDKMVNAITVKKYKEYDAMFDDLTEELDVKLDEFIEEQEKKKAEEARKKYSGFKSAGVLYDSQWRYTYYSSKVLRHYKTSQWTAGSDGIYRDSRGYVIVASDVHPIGTVLDTELFGTVVVEDCGVGNDYTLDVYVNF